MLSNLNAKADELAELINRKNYTTNLKAFTRYLSGFSALVKKFDFQCTAEVSLNLLECFHCHHQAAAGFYRVSCGHTLCSRRCLQEMLTEYFEMLGEAGVVLCKVCSQQLSLSEVTSILGTKRYEKWAASVRPSAQFTCGICLSAFDVSDSITLDCDHRYCGSCVKSFLELAISESQVSEASLACPDCGHPIAITILQANVAPEVFEKYERFMIRAWKPNSGEFIFSCPGVNCEFRALVPETEYKVTCEQCGTVCCPQCGEKPHKKLTCKEYAAWKRANNEGARKLAQMAEREGWVQCPKCDALCERAEGCNFMNCASAQCQKKTWFCYICGKQLRVRLM